MTPAKHSRKHQERTDQEKKTADGPTATGHVHNEVKFSTSTRRGCNRPGVAWSVAMLLTQLCKAKAVQTGRWRQTDNLKKWRHLDGYFNFQYLAYLRRTSLAAIQDREGMHNTRNAWATLEGMHLVRQPTQCYWWRIDQPRTTQAHFGRPLSLLRKGLPTYFRRRRSTIDIIPPASYPRSLHTLCFRLKRMRIICVPVLSDNFAYLLIDNAGVTAAVDPAQPDKVKGDH